MTGRARPPANERESTTRTNHLHLLVAHEENRRLLAEKLDPDYAVHTGVEALSNEPVDLCIVDEMGFTRHRATLQATKDAAEPEFVPCLLLTNPRRGRPMPRALDHVDELIRTPIDPLELRARLESLLHIRRLSIEVSQRERLQEMATILSHDLRNPLNVAIGNLDLARESDVASGGGDGRLDAVSDALIRMDDLLQDALSLAEQEFTDLTLEPTSLPTVARRAWTRPLTGDAEFESELGDEFVLADANRLEKLLGNLYRNAWEHNDETVTITVGTTAEGFYVADDGTGIPPSERSAVLGVGYTTREEGTGFGLSIVKRIADAHGWTVTVDEGPDGGARFEFGGVTFASEPTEGGGPTA